MAGQGDMWGFHTSSDPQDSHDADDGGVDGQRVAINLLQSDAHDGQQHDGQIQLKRRKPKATNFRTDSRTKMTQHFLNLSDVFY
ncbi:hypothetical protein EYF80_043716 [Liparis tanakae]|uniref:Uncharacterized protein n=1 Tax=Liparis tanakae TaxID=230148 RepID=A0A4Z2FXR4_9TELE|nr:hypothetical protein EYF80_043716 [Liparis tanakae]